MASRCSRSQKRRRLRMESLEDRRMLSAVPLGAMPADTGEYMLGSVAVTPVLLESNGTVDPSTEDWDAAEIDQVLANVAEGMQWWVDTLATFDSAHTLEFVIDDTYARTPVESPYEPISRRSDSYSQYVGAFLADQGYDGSSLTLEEAMRDFNHQQRLAHETNWAFTIFVVDSSNDADGMFAEGGTFSQAFGFAGGLFFITPSGRPASTYTHETGHMFWARDEYPNSGNYTDQRGYYNTQNTNAYDGAPPGFVQEPSIMTSGILLQTAYSQNISAASTLAQVGWQDTDGDGIFDVLDVPLELDVTGMFQADSSQPDAGQLLLRGTASAVPLLNANSSGLQNDITLNEVSQLQYRLDGGAWQVLSTPGQQTVVVDEAIYIDTAFTTLEVRAIDLNSGVTGPVFSVPVDRPTSSGPVSIDAFAFSDDNENGSWDAGEYLVPGVSAEITNAAGLFRGRVEPDDTADTIYGATGPVVISAVGNSVDGRVAAFSGNAATGDYVFQAGSIFGGFTEGWTAVKQQLQATFEQTTSDVSIIAIGQEPNSYARFEAYDSDGNLIARETSEALQAGETVTLRLHDPEGRIASVMAFGVNRTEVGLDDLRYGPAIATTSAAFGTMAFAGLPEGSYDLALESTLATFEVIAPSVSVDVAAGVATTLAIPMRRLASPWTNPVEPLDVNNSGVIQPLDALVVINELNRSSPRELTDQDPTPPYFDVNGDRSITPIDALRVINFLNRQGSGEGEAGGPLDPGPGGRLSGDDGDSDDWGGLTPEGESLTALTDRSAGGRAESWGSNGTGDRRGVPGPPGSSAAWAAAVDLSMGTYADESEQPLESERLGQWQGPLSADA